MPLEKEKHIQFLLNLMKDRSSSHYVMSIPIRVNNFYWGLTCLYLLDGLDRVNYDECSNFIISCQNDDGGFGANIGHDSNIHSSLCAIYCLILLDRLNSVNIDKLCEWVSTLQNEDGSFRGNEFDEVDTKFTYCAFVLMSLLGKMELININKGIEWLIKCENFDSGFGCNQDCETHGGQIFTVLGALSIANKLDLVDKDSLGLWLSERQCDSGGFNGRPEKVPDVCYSWWIGASLVMIGKQDWINKEKLVNFILSAQNEQTGGISDKPGNGTDPYHTFFGCSGLSLLNYPGIKSISPIYAFPEDVLHRHFDNLKKK